MKQQILIFIGSSKICVLVAILDLPQAISSNVIGWEQKRIFARTNFVPGPPV